MRFVLFLSIVFVTNALAETIYTPEKLLLRQEFAKNSKQLAGKIQTPYIKVIQEKINFSA